MKMQEEKNMVFLFIQRHLLQKNRGVKGKRKKFCDDDNYDK